MDSETKAALEASIQKWQAIVDGTGVDLGGDNCALCQLFCLGPSASCEECPVMTRTGESDCDGTPYDDWAHAQFGKGHTVITRVNGWKTNGDPFLIYMAQAELAFLISLHEEDAR